MNANRKIQLAAAVVIANGLLAVGVMGPSLAIASSCTNQAFCVSRNECQLATATVCNDNLPPGCTLNYAFCLAPSQGPYCSGNLYPVLCSYQ